MLCLSACAGRRRGQRAASRPAARTQHAHATPAPPPPGCLLPRGARPCARLLSRSCRLRASRSFSRSSRSARSSSLHSARGSQQSYSPTLVHASNTSSPQSGSWLAATKRREPGHTCPAPDALLPTTPARQQAPMQPRPVNQLQKAPTESGSPYLQKNARTGCTPQTPPAGRSCPAHRTRPHLRRGRGEMERARGEEGLCNRVGSTAKQGARRRGKRARGGWRSAPCAGRQELGGARRRKGRSGPKAQAQAAGAAAAGTAGAHPPGGPAPCATRCRV